MSENRETLASRLGFILLSAGCAIGLGNVWRFPFIVGKYGGCIFVLLYLLFLALLGFPLLMTEMAVGRGSHANQVHAFYNLSHKFKSVWGFLGLLGFLGCLLLMMYYTSVSGWLLTYTKEYIAGGITSCVTPEDFGDFFGKTISSPVQAAIYMGIVCVLGGGVCALGLKRGVEGIVKILMMVLLVLMIVLAIRSATLPGAKEGLKFYLLPNWENFMENPLETIFAAMGQAFFTLSIGIGSMEIFGSYLNWKTSLAKECIWIIILDTLVALSAGFIIFPICASKGIDMGTGPGLVFVSLPNVFSMLPAGQLWGSIFFAFLFMAALTTVIAVFENLLALFIDSKWVSRPIAALLVTFAVIVLSLPCVFGFSIWSGFQPLGQGTGILDLEDFLVSQNLLPLGGVIFLVFSISKAGWGYDNFLKELQAGQSWAFPKAVLFYWKWILPIIILGVFVLGYWQMFFASR